MLLLFVGILLLLVGLPLASEQVVGELRTELLRIENAAPFQTSDLGARDVSVVFRGTVSGANGVALKEQRILISIVPPANSDRESRTSIPGFVVPANASSWLELDSRESRFSLVIRNAPTQMAIIPAPGARVSIQSETCLASADCPAFVATDGMSALVLSGNSDDTFNLDLKMADSDATFADLIAIKKLHTWEVENLAAGQSKRSGLVGGRFQFASSPENSREFFAGEVLQLVPERLKGRAVRIGPSAIELQVSGRVSGVSTEIGDQSISLMPTWFDLLSQNRFVRFGVGAATILLALAQVFGRGLLLPWAQRRKERA